MQLDPQAISWAAPSSGVAGTTATLSATGGGSANPVVFSVGASSGAGVCSVSGTDGTTVDYAKAGSCVVVANQAGGPAGEPLYAAAPTVTKTITVVVPIPAPTPVTPAPVLTGIAPTSGSTAGGTVVTSSGRDLCSPSLVDFGSVPGSAVSVNASCTTLTVVDPPGSGTVVVVVVVVVVTTATGSAAAPIEFSYIAPGYWTVTSNGSVYSFGGAKFYGSLPSIGVVPNAPIVAMADTPDHGGYWLFSADGGVFAFGDARFYGSVPGVLGPEHRSLNKPIVAAEAMANGQGYRLFAADGGVFDFGDAGFVGALPCSAPGAPGGLCVVPNKPIESAVSNPLSQGYWLVGGDGGVFALGDAPFFGSLGAQSISYAIVSMAATPDGQGYWIFGTTGSVDTYGDATNYGSMLGQIPVSAPIAAGAATTNGHGYWLFGQNGGVYAFGSAPFDGSLQSLGASPSGLIVGGVGF